MRHYIVFLLFALLHPMHSFAQFGNDCLGIWQTIDIDLSKESGTDLVYTIPVPSEGIYLTMPNQFGKSGFVIQGPGSPYLFNYLGNTVELHLRKSHLLLEYEANPSECLLELFVNKKVSDWGVSSTNGNQCYYYIRLLLTM